MRAFPCVFATALLVLSGPSPRSGRVAFAFTSQPMNVRLKLGRYAGSTPTSPLPARTTKRSGQQTVNSVNNGNSKRRNGRSKHNAGNMRESPVVATQIEPWRAPFQVSIKTQEMIKATAAEKAGYPDHERAEAILEALLNAPSERCNEANVVCALTLSAKCMQPSSKFTSKLRSLLLSVLDILNFLVKNDRLKARQLCNAIYAIAKYYNKDNSILPSPTSLTVMSSEDMKGVAEAWILQDGDETYEKRLETTIELIAASLTNSLRSESQERPRKPRVGEVSMACWAYGVLRQRVRPPGWEIPPQLSRYPNISRARKSNKIHVLTYEQWANNVEEKEVGEPQDPVGYVFDAVAEFLTSSEENNANENRTLSLIQEMSWNEMANIAWAFASHGHCRTPASERLMAKLAREATVRLQGESSCLPRDISQLAWSIGILQSDNFRLGDELSLLIDAIARYAMQESPALERWTNADFVQLAVALAHGRIDHQQLLTTIYHEATLKVMGEVKNAARHSVTKQFHAWEVSILLWVQARLYLQAPNFTEFTRQAMRWLADRANSVSTLEDIGIGAQEQANLAWSLTVLEEFDSPDALNLLKIIFREASSQGTNKEFIQLEHAHQLWQALCIMEYECPEAVNEVPLWFRAFLKDKWSVEKARAKVSSARHRALSDTLKIMGVSHYNEHDEDIDVAIVLKEDASWTSESAKQGQDSTKTKFKVAIEFDGPLHFTREVFDDAGNKITPRTLGHTALKYRLLRLQGWAVVRVPYYEFDKIPFWASMERRRYLQRLLKTHENIRFSDVDVSEYKAITRNRQTRFD